jgi:hypothetical protein
MPRMCPDEPELSVSGFAQLRTKSGYRPYQERLRRRVLAPITFPDAGDSFGRIRTIALLIIRPTKPDDQILPGRP